MATFRTIQMPSRRYSNASRSTIGSWDSHGKVDRAAGLKSLMPVRGMRGDVTAQAYRARDVLASPLARIDASRRQCRRNVAKRGRTDDARARRASEQVTGIFLVGIEYGEWRTQLICIFDI